jgi:trk system potassium uptake protein
MTMRIIIVGCGRVGSMLATLLSTDGYDVTIIDRDADALKRLSKGYRGRTIVGNAFDQDVLNQAGIKSADAFASVTAGDNTNFILAAMARKRFNVPRVVTRIYDPRRADIYRRLGVPTISTTIWGAYKIRELLTYLGLTSVLTIASGEMEVVEAEVSPLLAGTSLSDLIMPGETQVVCIIRGGRAFIPSPSAAIERGDRVLVAVLSSAILKLERMLSP